MGMQQDAPAHDVAGGRQGAQEATKVITLAGPVTGKNKPNQVKTLFKATSPCFGMHCELSPACGIPRQY